MPAKNYRELFHRAQQSLDYWLADAEVEFTEELARVMAEQKVTRAELARRIGTSQAYITKVLRGNVNFTLATMVKLSRALEVDLRVHLARAGARTVWKDDVRGAWRYDEAVIENARVGLASAHRAARDTVWFEFGGEREVEISPAVPANSTRRPEVSHDESATAA